MKRPSVAELEGLIQREQEHTIEILPDGTIVTTNEKPPRVIERPAGPTDY